MRELNLKVLTFLGVTEIFFIIFFLHIFISRAVSSDKPVISDL